MPLRAPYTRGSTGETSRVCCRGKVFLRHRLQEPEVYRLPPIASVSPDASNRSTGQAGSGMQVLSKLRQSCVSFQTVSIHLSPFFQGLRTNLSIPTISPDMPACRNGANCTRPGCHFTHAATDIPCKFSPCLNPNCIYKHGDGQQKGFDNKVWMSNGPPNSQKREHVSERKFVNENEEEELIIPGQIPGQTPAEGGDMDTAPFDDVE